MSAWRVALTWGLMWAGACTACVGLTALVLSSLTPEGPTREVWAWVIAGCYGAGTVLVLWPESRR